MTRQVLSRNASYSGDQEANKVGLEICYILNFRERLLADIIGRWLLERLENKD